MGSFSLSYLFISSPKVRYNSWFRNKWNRRENVFRSWHTKNLCIASLKKKIREKNQLFFYSFFLFHNSKTLHALVCALSILARCQRKEVNFFMKIEQKSYKKCPESVSIYLYFVMKKIASKVWNAWNLLYFTAKKMNKLLKLVRTASNLKKKKYKNSVFRLKYLGKLYLLFFSYLLLYVCPIITTPPYSAKELSRRKILIAYFKIKINQSNDVGNSQLILKLERT